MSSDEEERVEKKEEDSGIQIIYVLKLLRRSNFYANLILAAIERKQTKREKKLETKLLRHEHEAKRQQMVETFMAQSEGSSPEIKLEVCQVMDDMLDEVVKDFDMDSDDEDDCASMEGSEYSQNSTLDSLLGLNTSPQFDDFDDLDEEECSEEEEECSEEEVEPEEYKEIDDDYVVEELQDHNPAVKGPIPTEEEYLEQLRIRRVKHEAMPKRIDKISNAEYKAKVAAAEAKEDQFNYGEKKEEPGKLAKIFLEMQQQEVKSEAADSVKEEIRVKNETEEVKCKTEDLEACEKSPAVSDIEMKEATLSDDGSCDSKYRDKVKTEILTEEAKCKTKDLEDVEEISQAVSDVEMKEVTLSDDGSCDSKYSDKVKTKIREMETEIVVVEKVSPDSTCESQTSQQESTDPLCSNKMDLNVRIENNNEVITDQSEKFPNKIDVHCEEKVQDSPNPPADDSVPEVSPECCNENNKVIADQSEELPNKMAEETALDVSCEEKVEISPNVPDCATPDVSPECDDVEKSKSVVNAQQKSMSVDVNDQQISPDDSAPCNDVEKSKPVVDAQQVQPNTPTTLYSGLPSKFACPICEKMFKLVTLDRHLDICTLKSAKRSSLRGSSKVDEVPLPKKCRRSNKRKAPVKTEVSGDKDSPTTNETTAKSDTVKPQEVPNEKKTRLKQAAGNVATVEGTTVSTAEPKNDKVEPKQDVLNRNKTTSEQTATTSTTSVERSTAIAPKCVSESDKQMSKAYKTVLSGMQHLKNAMQKTIESNNALASEKLQEEAALLQEENEKKALEEEKKKKAATRKRKAKSGGGGKSKKKKQLQETEEINIVVPDESTSKKKKQLQETEEINIVVPDESTSKTEKVAEGSPPSKTEVISLKSPAAEKSSSQESAAKVPGCSQETNKIPSNTSSQDSNAKVPSGGNSQDLCGGSGKDDDESRMAPPPMDDNLKKNNNTVEEAKEICSQQDSEKVKEKEPEKLTNVEEEKKVKDQESVKEDIKRPTVSRRSRKSRKYDDSDSDDNQMEEEEDQDEDDEELAPPPPPAAPSRRSSRAAANKVSYKDLDNSSSDDDEEAEDGEQEVPKRRKKKVPMKPELAYKQAKEKANRRKKKNESDDDYNPDAKDGDDKDEEEDEDEPTIDVEALFAKKFYIPAKEHQLPRKDRAAKFEKMKNPHPGQPKILTGGVLRDYQVTGFQWLKILFENGENGILADEMGLGKTIQCIAMICKLIQSGVSGPHIVVSPTTTLSNWYSEFQRFAPAVPVVFYHGNCEERSYLVKKFIHEVDVLGNRDYVLITSYEIMMRDRSVLTNFNWGYMVMDEAHRAKNFESQTLRELRRFLVKNKVLLTGTPLQNNLGELWTLLNFLFPDIFDEMKAFRNFFDFDLLCKDDKILNMLHQVLTPFLLRRTKNDVDVKIPPKREILVMVPMATLQKQYYDAIVDKSITRLLQNEEYYDETPGVADPDTKGERKNTKRELRDLIEKSTDKKGDGKLKTTEIQFGDAVVNVTMNNIMMQLRKCCNHPYLISYPLLPGTDDLRIDEDIVGSCGKVMLLDRMLPQLKERGHKVLLYSQMTAVLDIIEEYCNLREMSFVRFDGSTPCDQRFANIDRFNEDESIFLFLLSTRAGGLGVNLTAADTVIIYDSDWNPQNDVQAQDRCHRIGQTRPVVIYRLVAANTVDHKIVKRAAEKRVLENVIMHKGKFKGNLKNELKSKKSTTSERLLSILKETNKSAAVVASPSEVISETRLQQLLDRSDMTSSARTVSSDVTPANSQGGSSQEEGTSPQVKFKVILNSVVDENLCVT